jgi:hypothetical protein
VALPKGGTNTISVASACHGSGDDKSVTISVNVFKAAKDMAESYKTACNTVGSLGFDLATAAEDILSMVTSVQDRPFASEYSEGNALTVDDVEAVLTVSAPRKWFFKYLGGYVGVFKGAWTVIDTEDLEADFVDGQFAGETVSVQRSVASCPALAAFLETLTSPTPVVTASGADPDWDTDDNIAVLSHADFDSISKRPASATLVGRGICDASSGTTDDVTGIFQKAKDYGLARELEDGGVKLSVALVYNTSGDRNNDEHLLFLIKNPIYTSDFWVVVPYSWELRKERFGDADDALVAKAKKLYGDSKTRGDLAVSVDLMRTLGSTAGMDDVYLGWAAGIFLLDGQFWNVQRVANRDQPHLRFSYRTETWSLSRDKYDCESREDTVYNERTGYCMNKSWFSPTGGYKAYRNEADPTFVTNPEAAEYLIPVGPREAIITTKAACPNLAQGLIGDEGALTDWEYSYRRGAYTYYSGETFKTLHLRVCGIGSVSDVIEEANRARDEAEAAAAAAAEAAAAGSGSASAVNVTVGLGTSAEGGATTWRNSTGTQPSSDDVRGSGLDNAKDEDTSGAVADAFSSVAEKWTPEETRVARSVGAAVGKDACEADPAFEWKDGACYLKTKCDDYSLGAALVPTSTVWFNETKGRCESRSVSGLLSPEFVGAAIALVGLMLAGSGGGK